MRTSWLFASPLFLASCVLGPEPKAPGSAVPDTIRGDSAAGGDSFADRDWKKVFQNPVLKSLIDEALAKNTDLVAATYRIEQARAQAMISRADWFPALDGSGGASSSRSSVHAGQVAPGADRNTDSYNLTGALSWELDLWGGIRRSNQSARAQFMQAGYQRAAVKTSLVSSVAAAWIELHNLDERLAISKRTAESRKTSLDLVKARRDGGVSSDLELGQAEALLGQAMTAIPVTEKAIFAKENQIRYLMGGLPGSVPRTDAATLDGSMEIRAGLPSSLLERRPDVMAANFSYQSAAAEIGVAQALRLPSLSLTGSGGVISGDFSNLLDSGSATYSIGPKVAVPLFDGGRGKARVDAAKARAGEARASYDGAARLAFREAADAIQAHTQTGKIVAEMTKLVDANRKVARVANERFSGGSSSYLEVLDAERNLFNSELELADARRDRLLAVVQAYRALGGGWK